MAQELDQLYQLLGQWKAYRESGGRQLAGFASWLREQDLPGSSTARGTYLAQFPEAGEEYSENMHISLYWSMLDRFKYFLVKKAFADLPLHSLDDFKILAYANRAEHPRKADFIEALLLETTTAYEALKRFQRNGLLSEDIDPKDRRSKRIRLTELGKDVFEKGDARIRILGELLVGDLPLKQRKQILQAFKQLYDFHARLHHHYDDTTLENLYALAQKRLPKSAHTVTAAPDPIV